MRLVDRAAGPAAGRSPDVAMGNHAAAVTRDADVTSRACRQPRWRATARCGCVRIVMGSRGRCWVAQDADGFREVLPHLIAPASPANGRSWISRRCDRERAGGDVRRGIGTWRSTAYREALRTHDRPADADGPYGCRASDSRTRCLRQGRKADAWRTFRPAYEEVIPERAIGLLLLEPRPDRQ